MGRVLSCGIGLGRYQETVPAMLRDRRARFRGLPALTERRDGRETTLLWEDLYDQVARAGEALLRLGLRKGEVAAIYSRNRGDMLVFELAAMGVGAVACPIFAGYPEEPLDHILGHSGARFLAVSDQERLSRVLATASSRGLERIFLMDGRPGGRDAMAPRHAGKEESSAGRGATAPRHAGKEGSPASRGRRPVGAFSELLQAEPTGAFRRAARTVRPQDPALLMYTSGTSGRPKGVLLSHRNIMSQRRAMQLLWRLEPGGRVLSYLPWHHSFGGIFELFGALHSGAHLTLDDSYGKDLGLLLENFKRVKPTIYFSVPRIHQALVEESRRDPKAEREIFHPDLRFVFTAAAALPKHVADAYAEKGVPVVEGWGLTETSPCVTVTRFGAGRRPGLVGLPIPGVSVRVADDGEIQVKGPNVMLGYYQAPALTAEAFTSDGWFRTGDYGELAEDGLVLKCRVDGMFKLSNGEIVISQAVENALAASPLVQFAIVVGSGRDYVGALVFPNRAALAEAGASREAALGALKEELAKASSAIPEKYARPKAAIIASGEPGLENGQLTPTLKLVRSKILKDYAGEIEALYSGAADGRVLWI